jgi:K+-transporting ATPase ATPase A chain
MKTHEWVQLVSYLVALTAFVPLLGEYMAAVLAGPPPKWFGWLARLETLVYRVAGVDSRSEMRWTAYAAALLWFNLFGFLVLLVLQLSQAVLPLNPQRLPGVPFALAFNTAASFVTNTNWQAYSGEATLSYLTQMLGLCVQNFLSAATGIAVMLALTRGLFRKSAATVGNFWADLVRSTLYVLLPLSILWGLLLASQGVVQTFAPYVSATTLEGQRQLIPLGPAASQIAIKQLGTNGGGFFGVNSAHPFENPTPLSNSLEVFAILLIPAALTYTFGKMVGARRQGWALFAAMMILLLAGLTVALAAEYHFTGTMEGKETRFGVMNSVLWATTTTAASNGSVNAMHDSLSPLAGMIAMGNMMVGEVIFGGVGVGLCGMLMFVVLTVFIAGLMVGRTPEYLGKKIEAREITMAITAVLAPCATVLILGSLAAITKAGLSSIGNRGPHGLSEILYAFASMANNNGSAFAGLNANTNFYNYLGGAAMLVGRLAIIIPSLAIAGSLASKKVVPPSPGTFPTDGTLFVLLLVGVVLIVAALTFFPVLTLGPILEHLLLSFSRVF